MRAPAAPLRLHGPCRGPLDTPGANVAMPFFPFDASGVAEILGASRLRLGKFRASGVPAILLGASAIVVAAGVARALQAAAPTLPETLRESKNLLDAQRVERVLTP